MLSGRRGSVRGTVSRAKECEGLFRSDRNACRNIVGPIWKIGMRLSFYPKFVTSVKRINRALPLGD